MNAEKKCGKFRTGEVDYSPERDKAGKTWYFYKLLLKHKLRERNSFGALLSLSAELDIDDFYTMSVENIKKLVSSSRLDCLSRKFSASSRRNKHLLTIQ